MKCRIITVSGLVGGGTLAVCFEAGINSCRHCFVYGNRLVYSEGSSSGSIWKKSEI